jgi:hypothetical protein
MPPSAGVVEAVFRKADKLTELEPGLRGCHVVIEASARGHGPTHYRVTVNLSGGAGVARAARHATSDSLHIAMRDAFRASRRLLVPRERHARSSALSLPSALRSSTLQ